MPKLDFVAVNTAARHNLLAILHRWLPDGRVEGLEYIARNPKRADKRLGSFRIHVGNGPKCGVWRDFAADTGGSDPVSLCAYLFDMKQGEAARQLAGMLGVRHG